MLGLPPTATLTEVRDARRRLAFDLHPDRGGDAAAMQRLNAAFDACVAHLTGRRLLRDASPPAPAPPATAPTATGPRRAPTRRPWQTVEVDAPSFTVDALPPEAFEALLVVAATLGDVVDDDPPYVLESILGDPVPCWCRLEVMPDAGSSTVSLMVAALPGREQPPAETVRDVWVSELNRLGRPLP